MARSPRWGLSGPPQETHRHWAEEQEVIGPGLQAVMLWSRFVVAEAHGAVLSDLDGNEVLDLQGAGGVNSIGHAEPTIVAAMTAQLRTWTAGAFGSQARLDMTRVLRDFLPDGLDRIQLYSGGAEAVEAALRLAKSVTGKYEVLSFWGGFHGKTLGSLAMTAGARKDLGPLPGGFMSAPYANCYRCPFKLRYPGCGFACVDHAREVVKQQSTGALAAIVVEPVQGRSGNVVPPPGYLTALASVADEFDALLIVDEMMTGFGRTGAPFAFQHEGVEPDIVTVGKGMGAGYPVTGVIASAETMDSAPFSDPSASSSSFGAFPMACRAVETTVSVIERDGLVERAERLGKDMLAALAPLAEEAPLVGDVRGAGLAIGIELVEDKESRRPVSTAVVRQAFMALLEAGVLVMTGGNALRLYPPLNIDETQAHEAVDIIRRTLAGLPGPAAGAEQTAGGRL
ncbi:aspartate aminotransferase family protein [Planotetraspora sp. A-T 1434]|uniref:aspartate aminotransferase family protein n=1 Tax=Planotetraspora sp. A-T 1434 TaxID=2979219 RepID=UPI0021BF1152|nr:aspartate aminotransferase family protein [Planotetraspora sp. A-T 1434]MCT9935253.1 aspartate aminotransferase family protein [Planotetraspora sp. A-T 1434]